MEIPFFQASQLAFEHLIRTRQSIVFPSFIWISNSVIHYYGDENFFSTHMSIKKYERGYCFLIT